MLALVLWGCQIKAEAAPNPTILAGTRPLPGPMVNPSKQTTTLKRRTTSRSVTLAFAGDVHFEGRVAALLDGRDATLGPMSSALRSADVAVVNLESALTSGGSPAPKELEDPSRRYWFRSPPSALALLERSGVDAVSLANNHGADYGAAGLRDTLRAARNSPVAVIEVGRDPEQAFRPYQTSVDGVEVAVLAADASPLESASIWDVELGGLGLAAARESTRLLAAVRAANARSDVVAVYLHWGEENRDARPPNSASSPGVSLTPGPMWSSVRTPMSCSARACSTTPTSAMASATSSGTTARRRTRGAPPADRGRQGRPRRLGTREDQTNRRSVRDRISTHRRDPGMARFARLHRPRARTRRKGVC